MKKKILSFFMTATVFAIVGIAFPVLALENNNDGLTLGTSTEHIHSLVKTEAVTPDCTKAGNGEYWTCSECGKMFSDDTGITEISEIPSIPALGHTYSGGICTVCGVESAWSFNELSGTLTVLSNEGTVEWQRYIDPTAVRNIEIIQGVTRIEDYSFMYCTEITSVTIPDGVKYLGWYSFYGCECLETVTLSTGVIEIGYAAFNLCTNLRSLIIPSSIQTISLPIFDYCQNLESVGYPAKMRIMVVPTTTAKYSYDVNIYGDLIVHVINNGGRKEFHIPDVIEGKTVKKIINSTDGRVIHNHSGGIASCIEKAVCEVCGQEYGEKTAHAWNSGEITVPPTCTENGIKTYTCTVDGCGAVKTEVIPAAGHIEDNGMVTKLPTFTETGVKTFSCTICGCVIRTEIIPAEGISPAPPYMPLYPSNTAAVTSGKEPYMIGVNCKTGWDSILDVIIGSPDGSKITVNMNGTTELPKRILSAIQGRNVDLILEMGGGFVWTIKGLSVTNVKSVDMGVKKISGIPQSVIRKFLGNVTAIQFELSHNGDFGFIAMLTVEIEKKYNGMFANSYCYKSDEFEFGDSGEIAKGKTNLRFDHASKWLITIDKYPALEDVSSGAEIYENNNSNNSNNCVLIMFFTVVLITALIATKQNKT